MKSETKITLIPMLIILVLFLMRPSCAQEKITFDKGIGFYVYAGGKTDYLYWTAEDFVGDMGRIEKFEKEKILDVPKDVKFFCYGLEIGNIRPPHLMGFGFSYVNLNNQKMGKWAARFFPIYGYKEKVYEIVFDGPLDELKSGEIKYKFIAFEIGNQDAFLFRYKDILKSQ